MSADDYYTLMGLERDPVPPVKRIKGSYIKPKESKKENISSEPEVNTNVKADTSSKEPDKLQVVEPIQERKEENKPAKEIIQSEVLLFPGTALAQNGVDGDMLLFPEYETKVRTTKEKHPELDMEDTVRTILNCLVHISEERFYGIGTLINTLKGSKNKDIEKYGMNRVTEYGKYSDMSRADLRAIIQWLLDNHFMIQTKGQYPKLHITYEGNRFDEKFTPSMLKKLIKYADDPNRESFEDEENNDE